MTPLLDEIQVRLGADFVIERELGGGGMSRVFVANDLRLERRVVIKVLRPELGVGVSVERFRREILLAASLQHPLIVPVLDVGDLEGLPYFLMPFVDGESLRARLSKGPLSVVDTVRILRDVARALAVAHARGVVHRDIKPDNVLLSGDAAVVADFGVAKAFASSRAHDDDHHHAQGAITTVGTSLGTPAYMAPEQVAADPNGGFAIDIYAVGVMAYEMLSGATPFAGRPPQAIMAAHVTEAPLALEVVRPELPSMLAALVMRCLHKDPQQRPGSASALVDQLEDPTLLSGAFTPIPDHAAARISGTGRLTTQQLLGTNPAATNPSLAATQYSKIASALRTRFVVVAVAVVAIGAAVWAVRTPGGFAASAASATNNAASPTAGQTSVADLAPSVAVLPFVFLGEDSTQRFIADAISDAIANGLSGITGLRVASRTTAERIQSQIVEGDSSALSVQTLVEGVVEVERGTVRITLRLVDARDGFTIYSDRVDGDRGKLFDLEDTLAAAMRERLQSHYALSDSLTAP